jgi:hypothetical protein
MGSSDPLPVGFEIRFGSLSFQATGTATSCASPTATNSVRGGKLGQPRSLSHLSLGHQRPPARMLRAPQRLDTVDVPVSTLDKRGRSADGLRAPSCRATRPPAGRQPLRRGRGLGLRTATLPRLARHYDVVRRLRQHRRGNARGSPWPPCSGHQGPQCFRRRRVVPRLHQRAATRHFARVRGVGLLRDTGPSDVPTVPRRHKLLVRLLRRLQRWELRPRVGVLRRDHQRPSKRRERGRSWRRRGSPRPGNWTAPGSGAKCSSLLTAGGRHQRTGGSSAKLEAKLAEEYHAVRLLRASIAGKASARGERVRELGRQARECINADFNVDDPNMPPRASFCAW